MTKRIITLTAIPPRFREIGATLKSLVEQRTHIDEIRLHIPKHYRRFPDYGGELPEVPEGVTIYQPERDFGPASKILPAVEALQGQDCAILFCDDDRFYAPDWAESLFRAHFKQQGHCIALSGKNINTICKIDNYTPKVPQARHWYGRIDIQYRLRRFKAAIVGFEASGIKQKPPRRLVYKAGYADLFAGYGGVVVRPEFFPNLAFEIPKIIWSVDDIWLSGMMALSKTPIWLPQNLYRPLETRAEEVDSLRHNTFDGAERSHADRHAIEYLRREFKIWSDLT